MKTCGYLGGAGVHLAVSLDEYLRPQDECGLWGAFSLLLLNICCSEKQVVFYQSKNVSSRI